MILLTIVANRQNFFKESQLGKILVIHGPNLNLLGTREVDIYGNLTLDGINEKLNQMAAHLGHSVKCKQSNAEHELINFVQNAKTESIDFIIINPAAYTHTSIALRDAFLGIGIPFIEVHLSNIKSRETYRHHSYLSDIAHGVIFGFGPLSYELGLHAANEYLKSMR